MRIKNLTTSLLLALATYLPQIASANPVAESFRQAALEAINEAQQLGFNNFGDINFTDLKKFAQNVHIGYYPNITFRVENRRCAMWQNYNDMNSKMPPIIQLNKGCLDISKEDLKTLALHEILGAGFAADSNYDITLQIKHKKSANTWLLNNENIKSTIKNFVTEKHGENGTSTGVGGGGDSADFRFKYAGLQYLETLDTEKLWNIPKDLLRYSLYQMHVKPAKDIKTVLHLRGSGVEENLNRTAVVYVNSDIYRNQTDPNNIHGITAVMAARLYLLYAADEMGLVNERVGYNRTFTTSSINKPCLALGSGPKNFVVWKNPTLLSRYSKTEVNDICTFEIQKLYKAKDFENDKIWSFSSVLVEDDVKLQGLEARRAQLLREIEQLQRQ